MTTCAIVEAQLEQYLSGGLSASDSEALELHAAECAHCGPIMEARTRLDQVLPKEVAPDPARRTVVLAAVASRRAASRRRRWWVPVATAAGLLLAFGLLRPNTKSGQLPPVAGSPAAIAAERADGEFRQLDAARAELREAITKSPGDPMLVRALERLDAQRKSLEHLIQEFES